MSANSLWPVVLEIDVGPGKRDQLEIYHEDETLVRTQVKAFIKRNRLKENQSLAPLMGMVKQAIQQKQESMPTSQYFWSNKPGGDQDLEDPPTPSLASDRKQNTRPHTRNLGSSGSFDITSTAVSKKLQRPGSAMLQSATPLRSSHTFSNPTSPPPEQHATVSSFKLQKPAMSTFRAQKPTKECSFRPTLNENSMRILNRSQSCKRGIQTKVHQRLHYLAKVQQDRIAKKKKESYDQQEQVRKQKQPKDLKKYIKDNKVQFSRLYDVAMQNMKIRSQINSDVSSKRTKYELKDATFQPELNSKSKVMMAKREFMMPEDALLLKGQLRDNKLEQKRIDKHLQTMRSISGIPQIDERSRQMASRSRSAQRSMQSSAQPSQLMTPERWGGQTTRNATHKMSKSQSEQLFIGLYQEAQYRNNRMDMRRSEFYSSFKHSPQISDYKLCQRNESRNQFFTRLYSQSSRVNKENNSPFSDDAKQRTVVPFSHQKEFYYRLYNESEILNAKLKEKQQQQQREMKDQCKSHGTVDDVSAMIVDNLRDQKLHQLFSILDHDNDGYLIGSKLTLDNLPNEAIDCLAPVLLRLAKEQGKINYEQFRQRTMPYIKKLTVLQKHQLLGPSPQRQEDSGQAKGDKPSLSKRSQYLATKKRSNRGSTQLYEYLNTEAEKYEQNKLKMQQAKLEDEMKECTFQPNLGKKAEVTMRAYTGK